MTIKLTIALCLLLVSVAVRSGDMPDSIDAFTAGEPVEFVRTYDPLCIVLKLSDGGVIDTGYDDAGGKIHPVLQRWEDERNETGQGRKLLLTYTNEHGVRVRDPENGTEFALTGVLQDHPIDRAERAASETCATTRELVQLKRLALEAWEAELDRAYQLLGGDGNAPLKQAREAWAAFRDAQMKQIVTLYSERGGTISSQLVIQRETDLVRAYAKCLQDVFVW